MSQNSLTILQKCNIPTVVFDRALDDATIPCVMINNDQAGALAAEYLVSPDHQYIACVTGPLSIELCPKRFKGFRRVFTSIRLYLTTTCFLSGTIDEKTIQIPVYVITPDNYDSPETQKLLQTPDKF